MLHQPAGLQLIKKCLIGFSSAIPVVEGWDTPFYFSFELQKEPENHPAVAETGWRPCWHWHGKLELVGVQYWTEYWPRKENKYTFLERHKNIKPLSHCFLCLWLWAWQKIVWCVSLLVVLKKCNYTHTNTCFSFIIYYNWLCTLHWW